VNAKAKKRIRFFVAFAILTIAFAVISVLSARWLRVDEHRVYFDDLPAHLQGLRILHISDLHSDHPERMNVNIWRHIDELDFDIAVITGDIITDNFWPMAGPINDLDPHKPYLAALAQRVPTFFVEGNHEVRTVHLIKQIMEDLGITFLFNEVYHLEINGGMLEVVGTRDHSVLRRELVNQSREIVQNLLIGDSDFRLVLTHQPQVFDYISDMGQMLVLAGHSHGGQLRMPFLPVIYAPDQGFFPAYGAGFYHNENATLYVSTGVGVTYFRWRFWNRPVITIHELQSTQTAN